MTNPVPGYRVSTPYKKTGPYWKACGWHTGQDYGAPKGARVVAARGGTAKHVNYGSSFGTNQLAVICADGTEDFYAHMSWRCGSGKKVKAGDHIGAVGAEGNVTGPHLHFERHKKAGAWSCSNMDDPMKSHNSGGTVSVAPGDVYLSKLKYGQTNSDSVARLQTVLNGHKLTGGATIDVSSDYLVKTDDEVRKCQTQHGFGNDPAKQSSVGPQQAEHLFAGTGNTVVNDLDDTEPEPEPPPIVIVSPPTEQYLTQAEADRLYAAKNHTHPVPGADGGDLMWQDYTGKPANPQVVSADAEWHKISTALLKPVPASGREDHMVYLRVNFRWKTVTGNTPTSLSALVKAVASYQGKVEVKFRRGDGDETAFDERHFTYGTKSIPFQHLHWELGERGLAGQWYIKCHGGLTSVELTTRYAKTSVIVAQ